MRDVTKALIVQLKMAYIHSNIDTCDRGQVCKSSGRIWSCVTVYKLGGKREKDCNHNFDGLTGITRVGPVNALGHLLK